LRSVLKEKARFLSPLKENVRPLLAAWDNETMNNRTFETHDLRIRIEDNIVRIDQRRLDGELWREIDHSDLPVSQAWLMSPIRTSPLRVALSAFEIENPGDTTLRKALEA
jgi:hypothetical protein